MKYSTKYQKSVDICPIIMLLLRYSIGMSSEKICIYVLVAHTINNNKSKPKRQTCRKTGTQNKGSKV